MTRKEQFIKSVYPYAVKSSDILKSRGVNIDPRWITAQWAHETGYGRNTGTKYNNLAGLWAYPNSPHGISGKKYDSLDDFVVDYTNIIMNKRYDGIRNSQNVTEFASALRAGGYATDPNYAYATTWTEAVTIASNLGATAKDKTVNLDPKWYQLYRTDPKTGQKNIVSWRDFFLGSTLENNDGEISIVDNTRPDNDPLQRRELLNSDFGFTDLIKIGFFQIMIFLLVLFFLYGALLKDSTIDKIGRRVISV